MACFRIAGFFGSMKNAFIKMTDDCNPLRANFDGALIGVFNRICHDFFHGNSEPETVEPWEREDNPGFLFLN